MATIPALSESEWLIMIRLWEKSPLTASELVGMELDGKRLPDPTVRTLLRRLITKNAVDYTVDEQNANLYRYFPLISKADCIREENKHFLELYYRNNASKLFAAFMDDADLSSEEIEEFKKLLDAKQAHH